MTTLNFDVIFQRLVGNEGVLSLDPHDRGNWTGGKVGLGELRGSKFGISAAAYPHLVIADLSVAQARELYRQDYWNRMQADQYPPALAYQMFDAAVNHGPETAVRLLQRAVGVADDGDIGPVTMRAVQALSLPDVLARFNGVRLDFMTRLSGWDTQGRGWARRIVANLNFEALDS
jgi:lysozyme family protein